MRDDHVDKDAERRHLNEVSERYATRRRASWTDDEDMIILDEWVLVDPQFRDELGVAKRLSRTLFACQGRAEQLRALLGVSNEAPKRRKQDPRYIGVDDDPEDQWWSPDYYK
jgi:hypothetical protein